jgi:gluconolactonase
MHVQVLDARFDATARGCGALERLATGATWSEGPVWMHEDGSVLWSDIPADRMLRWHPREGLSVWRAPCGFTNGHVREAGGALLHCSHGRRAVLRTRFVQRTLTAAGEDEVVVDRYQGRRLNSPNDVVVKRDGTIWFTDPPYGIVSDREGHRAQSEQRACHVFRFDPATGALRSASDWAEHPNGLAFSPDERTLYVTDTSAALAGAHGHHHIVAFDVIAGADLANPRVFAVVEPGLADGIRVDVEGRVWASSADAVQVFHPDGTRLARVPVPEVIGNLVFGGPRGDELYIVASTSLYRIAVGTRGATAA